MTLPHQPVSNARGQVRADALRGLGRAAELHDRLTVGGGLNHALTAGGPVVTDPRFQEILVRIVSGTNPYRYQEQYSTYDSVAGTITYTDHLEGLSGNPANAGDTPLFEINANRTLGPDTRVFARLSDDGLALVVTRCCGAAVVLSGDTSGAGDDLVATNCGDAPQTLVASFADGGRCPCLDGLDVGLIYDPALGYWAGSEEATCGGETTTVDVTFGCSAGAWYLHIDCTKGGTNQGETITVSSGALPSLTFVHSSAGNLNATCCDGGSGDATITVSA